MTGQMDESNAQGATALLLATGAGDAQARERMLPLIYNELRSLAAQYLRRERSGHTLEPTALVHEAYCRLIDQRRVDWSNRAQFIGLAAVMMRRILVNHARDRVAAKRGGGSIERVPLTIVAAETDIPEIDLLWLHEALDQLAELDTRKSQIVELKFFGGLTMEEIAATIGVSRATVEREWTFSRAWLYRTISGTG